MSNDKSGVLRLRKKHLPKARRKPTVEDARRLLAAQSVRNAVVASLITIIVFSTLWAMLSTLIHSIYPWMTLIQGILIGLAVRRAGFGLDWRFPAIAALFAAAGALIGNIVVAAAFTAPELGTSTLNVLRNLTALTWPVFFEEVMTPADLVFAMFAAGLAAFYANRRLSREQNLALRFWENTDVEQD